MSAGGWRSWFDPRPWWRAWLELDDNPIYHYFRAVELQRSNPRAHRLRWLPMAITALVVLLGMSGIYWIELQQSNRPPDWIILTDYLMTSVTPVVLMWYIINFLRLGTDVLSILAPIRRTWRMQLNDSVLVTPVSGVEIVTATLAVVLERMRWDIPAGAVLVWWMYHFMNNMQALDPCDPQVLQILVFAPLSILLISTCGYLACQLIMLVLLVGGLGTRQRSFAWSVSAVVTLLTIFASALTLVVHVLRTEFEARTQLPVLLFDSLGVLLLLGLATHIAIRVPFLRGSGVLLVPVAAVIVAAGLYLADNTGSGPASHSEVINAFSIIAPFNIIAASNPLLDGRLDAHQPFLYDSGNWRQRLLHTEGQEWWRWPHLIIAQLLALWLLCNMARLAVSVRRNM